MVAGGDHDKIMERMALQEGPRHTKRNEQGILGGDYRMGKSIEERDHIFVCRTTRRTVWIDKPVLFQNSRWKDAQRSGSQTKSVWDSGSQGRVAFQRVKR
jgi:hypothetical protein